MKTGKEATIKAWADNPWQDVPLGAIVRLKSTGTIYHVTNRQRSVYLDYGMAPDWLDLARTENGLTIKNQATPNEVEII